MTRVWIATTPRTRKQKVALASGTRSPGQTSAKGRAGTTADQDQDQNQDARRHRTPGATPLRTWRAHERARCRATPKTSGHSLPLSRAPSHAPPTCPVDAARPVPWRPDPAGTDLRPQQSSREAWDEQGSTPGTRALGTSPNHGRERSEAPEYLAAGDSVRRGARLGLGGVYSPWKGRAREAGPLRLH